MNESTPHVTPAETDFHTDPGSETTPPPRIESRRVQLRFEEICRVAVEMYETRPHWVAFFREILGVDGVMRRLLPKPDEVERFERSTEFQTIQGMLTDLRRRKRGETQGDDEPTKVITVRLPASVHEWLFDAAEGASTSMNKLCITKLLQVLGKEENE